MDSTSISARAFDIESNNELESIERKIEELGREEENNLKGDRN